MNDIHSFHKELTKKIRYCGLLWARYTMKASLFATEVGKFNSDLAFVKEDFLYEVEIKVSMQDFKKDFLKEKHEKYSANDSWTPNYFYFFVPQFLRDKALTYLKGSNYGLLVYRDLDVDPYKKILHVKKPNLLIESKVDGGIKMEILKRMGNELIARHTHY